MMRILKIISKCLLTFILLFFIFWAILLGTLQTKMGETWVIDQLVHYLENKTGTQIQVEKIQLSFPLNFNLKDLKISQDELPILIVQQAKLSCFYSFLLQGRIVCSLESSGIDIFQIPSSLQVSPSDTQLTSQSWDDLIFPVYVKVENINIRKIRLKPDVIKALSLPVEVAHTIENSFLNLQGMISNNPFKGFLGVHLLASLQDKNSHSKMSVGIDAQNHHLSLSFHIAQFPLQFMPMNLVNSKAHVALYASAPIYTWQNLTKKHLLEEEMIEGHFKVSLHLNEESSPLYSILGPTPILRGRYHLKSIEEIELINLNIKGDHALLDGNIVLTADHKINHGVFKGELDDLKYLNPLLKQNIYGPAQFEGNIKGALFTPSIQLNIQIPMVLFSEQTFKNIAIHFQATPQLNEWTGSLKSQFNYQDFPWHFTTLFHWNPQQHLSLSHLKIDALHTSLEGEISCLTQNCIWEGSIQAQTKNLNDISQFLEAPIQGEAELKVHLLALQNEHQKQQGLHCELHGRNLQWKEWQTDQLHLKMATETLHQGQPISIQTELSTERLRSNQYSIEQCQVKSHYFVNWAQRNIYDLSTDWKAQGIQWEDGQAAQAQGTAFFASPLRDLEGKIQLAMQDVKTSNLQLEELIGESQLRFDQPEWPFYVKVKGFWKEKWMLVADGTWNYNQNQLELQANHLQGQFGPYPFQIQQSVHFFQSLNQKKLTNLHFQLGEAELHANFNQHEQQINGEFKTNAVPSEIFHFVALDLPLAGRATFTGYLHGTVQDPKGQLQIDLHHLQVLEELFTQKPFFEGKMNLHINGSQGIQLSSELYGIGHTPLIISGSLPFVLRLDNPILQVNENLPFHLALDAEGELDPYLHLFYNNVTNLSGQAKIALKIGGLIHAPQVQGHIDLFNGTYESLSTGALYHNIQAHLEGDGSRIVLTQFSAHGNKNGVIKATGAVTLDPDKQFPFEFQIHPSHIFFIDSDYAAISASGPLTLVGTTKQSKLQGTLTVDHAQIHLEETLPRQIKTIDVKYINLSTDERLPSYLETKEQISPIEFDIKLKIPHYIVIEGNRLTSEWKGEIAIVGTPASPQLHGDLRIIKGEYNFNGKIFNLSQGTIHFAGPLSKKTTLYIVASKEIDPIRAEIIVKGPINKPEISFRSNPPLSQREVLSYLLFNRGISDITPDQGDQLSQSFMSLNSSEQTNSSDDFLSRVRNNIGIDRLDFATSDRENKDIGLQVGKNITENIVVSLNQSINSIAPRIAIEAKLRKNLKAQAETGLGGDTNRVRMSLKWKKDY